MSSRARTKHVVDTYARDVVAKRIPAGRLHLLACERHERDRAHEGTADFPFVFRSELADRFYRFAERLPHLEGKWAGQLIVLEPWQRFRLGSLFGWLHVDTGLRRFRVHYNEIPRKNGKSLEAGLVVLYLSFFDGEPGAQGYCAATKRDQAKIVFGVAHDLVERSTLRRRIKALTHNLHRAATRSKLEPLGADHNTLDGLNPHVVALDEFHKLKDRGMLDVLDTATGAREQPVRFEITTAGDDPLSPCGDEHEYARKILERVLVDETFFAFIAHADEADDWREESTWRKANPNYGISVNPDDLRAKATKARSQPSAVAAFQQLHTNLWVNRSTPWLSMDGWRAGQSHDDLLRVLARRACHAGVDLSSKTDLTGIALAFEPVDDDPRWRYLGIALTPEDTLDDRAARDRVPYRQWKAEGWLRTNPGKRIDHGAILQILVELGDLFDIQEIGIDPWNAGNLPTDLEAESFLVTEVPQNFAQMSPPSKEFDADVLGGLVDFGGNPLATWQASNVVVTRDNKDNIYPTKKKSRGRIDLIVAAIIARKMATDPPEDVPTTAYADRGVECV